MVKIALLVCVSLLIQGATWAGAPATQPALQPALKETEPVRVNGVDFQIVAPVVWLTPAAKDETPIPLALKLTNQGDHPLHFYVTDTVILELKDAQGKKCGFMGSVRAASYLTPPVLVDKGQSATIQRDGGLAVADEAKHTCTLACTDGAGGTLTARNLTPGKYTLTVTYRNTDAGPKDAPNWVGEATTKGLAIEISDKPG